MAIQASTCSASVNNFDVVAFKNANLIDKTAKKLAEKIVTSLVHDRVSDRLDSKQIIEKYKKASLIITDEFRESNESISDIEMVCYKLYKSTTAISTLASALRGFNPEASFDVVIAFVSPETHRLMKRLRKEHPGAIETKELWTVKG
jgi:hypothetical protein